MFRSEKIHHISEITCVLNVRTPLGMVGYQHWGGDKRMASLRLASKMLQTPSSWHRERLEECVSVLEWLLSVCVCVLLLNELFAVLCREEGVGKQPSLTWVIEIPSRVRSSLVLRKLSESLKPRKMK